MGLCGLARLVSRVTKKYYSEKYKQKITVHVSNINTYPCSAIGNELLLYFAGKVQREEDERGDCDAGMCGRLLPYFR